MKRSAVDAQAERAPWQNAPGERRELWRILARLAMVQIAGPVYLDKVRAAVRHYV